MSGGRLGDVCCHWRMKGCASGTSGCGQVNWRGDIPGLIPSEDIMMKGLLLGRVSQRILVLCQGRDSVGSFHWFDRLPFSLEGN